MRNLCVGTCIQTIEIIGFLRLNPSDCVGKSSEGARFPGGAGGEHVVEGDEQFAGDGDESELFGFATGGQAAVEMADALVHADGG